jgi:hypothetical protein
MSITVNQRDLLETFCQYGDLKKAKLVFVGMEEGLGGNNADIEIRAREELFNNPIFSSNRIFVNGKNSKDGWYINDSTCLIKAQALAKKISIATLSLIPDYSRSQAMQNQARIHWLLQKDNRTKDYEPYKQENFKNYPHLNKPTSESAMIDLLPFPNQGELASEYQVLFSNKIKYENHYLSTKNKRLQIIKDIYEKYPIPLSINYSGFKNGKFPMQDFFEKKLGFKFHAFKNTSVVNPLLIGTPIKPSKIVRFFVIGERENEKGLEQKLVLTPFLGMGQFARNDVDVVSTWL